MAGNVTTLWQENKALSAQESSKVTGSNGIKRIDYEFDLVSGKVNKVKYQDGKWDQFYYQYQYDGENRIIGAYSSRTNTGTTGSFTNWKRDALYTYYLHGPLARVALGNEGHAQGLDYAYTLQGWLKGVNGQFLNATKDIANDGNNTSSNPFAMTNRDAIAYSLGYYNGDYSPIGGTSSLPLPAFGVGYTAPVIQTDATTHFLIPSLVTGNNLYNGNISFSTYAIQGIDNGKTSGYTYRYDQLNRLVAMDKHSAFVEGTTTGWDNSSFVDDYKERITYDANGNIKTYLRNGNSSALSMDNLGYAYNVNDQGRLVNNRLRHIKDAVGAPTGQGDIGNEPDDNYTYDNIGNLAKDQNGNINKIDWTVNGKISQITKADGSTITYGYDATGNRISKTVTPHNGTASTSTATYYTRDAQGNVLGVYGYDPTTTHYTWNEQHLYGSSRLGMLTPALVQGTVAYDASKDDIIEALGNRKFELTNHLGNVLATITDKTIQVFNGTTFDHNKADVVSAQDYYPFGMQMPTRTFVASGGSKYRYGFNGQEHSTELDGDDYTAQFWEYDARTGRRWNTDPEEEKMPELSPYSTNGDNPIKNNDPNGDVFGLDNLIGLGVGALVDYGSQVIANYNNPNVKNPFTENINVTSIVTSAATGFLTDGVSSVGKVLLVRGTAAVLNNTVKYTTGTKGGTQPTKGGWTVEKNVSNIAKNAVVDLTVDAIAGGIAEKGGKLAKKGLSKIGVTAGSITKSTKGVIKDAGYYATRKGNNMIKEGSKKIIKGVENTAKTVTETLTKGSTANKVDDIKKGTDAK